MTLTRRRFMALTATAPLLTILPVPLEPDVTPKIRSSKYVNVIDWQTAQLEKNMIRWRMLEEERYVLQSRHQAILQGITI